jgi:hypothetical protein
MFNARTKYIIYTGCASFDLCITLRIIDWALCASEYFSCCLFLALLLATKYVPMPAAITPAALMIILRLIFITMIL